MAHTATVDKTRLSNQRHLRHGSRHRAVPWLLLLLLSLTGCVSYRVDQATQLNAGLCYFPWKNRSLCATTPEFKGNVVAIQPGMKVTLANASFYQYANNLFPPPLASYEWIMPQKDATGHVKYGQQDFFFLTYILSAGIPSSPLDGSVALVEIRDSLSDPRFFDSMADRVLVPAFRTLRMESSNSGPQWADCGTQVKDCTATLIRRWLTEPTKTDMPAIDPGGTVRQQKLTIDFVKLDGGSVTYSVFDWNSGFFHEHPSKLQGASQNPWYAKDSDVFNSRAHVGLEIPVRFLNEISSRYVPIYWSVADLEKRFDVIVRGLRRNGDYLGALDARGRWLCRKQGHIEKPCFLDDNGYFTLGFGDFYYGFGARGYLSAEERLKPDLLLAPGDVVIVERGPAATDLPGSR